MSSGTVEKRTRNEYELFNQLGVGVLRRRYGERAAARKKALLRRTEALRRRYGERAQALRRRYGERAEALRRAHCGAMEALLRRCS